MSATPAQRPGGNFATVELKDSEDVLFVFNFHGFEKHVKSLPHRYTKKEGFDFEF